MGDLLHPQRGARPWRPTEDSKLVRELDHYNIPLAGLVEQGDATYLFACLFGEMGTDNIWGYVHLSGLEAARLRRGELGEDALVDHIEHLFETQGFVIAVALDFEIVDSEYIEPHGRDIRGIVASFVREWSARLRDELDHAESLTKRPDLVGT